MKKNKTPEQEFKEWFYTNCTKDENGAPVVRLTPDDLYKRIWQHVKYSDEKSEEYVLEQIKKVGEHMKQVLEILNKIT
jgi:hypothetical protein